MLEPISLFKERYGDLRYFFAPMAGISDTVFRLLMRELGAQCVVSELLSAEGLIRGGQRTRDMMQFDERERPVGIQLFGYQKSSLAEAARIVEAEGADFVDLNFGCPVKKVVCDGGGAAWLKDPVKLGELLETIKKGLRIPLTIKVRTGWDDSCKNVNEVVRVAAESGVSWVAIHGRTGAQGYSGHADWELIREVAIHSKIPVIGNGDIVTAEMAKKRIDEGYAHAVMIGRGALKNPWIFREILGEKFETKNFIPLINRHFDLAIEKKDRHRAFLSLKKFLAWYAAGFPNSGKFRFELFQLEDIDALRQHALTYFETIPESSKVEDNQPFLMGGHG
jgi:nifR3 family TIM-barrel protein